MKTDKKKLFKAIAEMVRWRRKHAVLWLELRPVFKEIEDLRQKTGTPLRSKTR